VLNYHGAYGGKGSLAGLEGDEEQEWVVVVKEGTSDETLKSMCKQSKNSCNLVGHPAAGGVPFVELRGTEEDLKAVVTTAGGAVRYIEPDATVYVIPEIPADVGVQAATWGLNRVAADQRAYTGDGSYVFVLDTGVRSTHVEFGGRASSSLDMSEGGVECNGDLSCAADNQGHGTHCAGSAAGATFGVAPGAMVRSVKVLGDNGSGSWSWSYGALDWLATNQQYRPAVASMSLGGSGTQQAMRDAVDAAVNAGVVVVVAGGNSNSDACNFSPAFVPSAITVGSMTSLDARSSFSNYGSCTDIWAPGSDVVSAAHTSDTGSVSFSGTSMACPHVSGGVALIMQETPGIAAGDVVETLLDNAEWNALSGLRTGDTNALLFVGAGGGGGRPPPPPPTPAPAPGDWVLTGSGCEMSGDCVESLNYPSPYGNGESCQIALYGSIDIYFTAFDTESGYDFLTIGGRRYAGTTAPPDGFYTGTIGWSTDGSVTKSGWKLCRGARAPTPAPAPTPPANWELVGSGCTVSGNCAQSLNYPSNYGNGESCQIELGGATNIAFTAFNTESRYDFLTIGGTAYSGSSPPPDGVYTGVIDWATDYSVTRSGWKLCAV